MNPTTNKMVGTAGFGTALAAAVAGFLGAFSAAPQQEPIVFPNNQAIEAGQWEIRPIRAYVAERPVLGLSPMSGQSMMVLEVELQNRTGQSTNDYLSVFHPAGELSQIAAAPTAILTRDQAFGPELHPGMPERMAFIWHLPPMSSPPAHLSFTVQARTFKLSDNLYGTPNWLNPHLIGTLQFPIDRMGNG